MNPKKSFKIRMIIATIVVTLWGVGISYRLVQLQVFGVEAAREMLANQSRAKERIPAHRGDIVDRHGNLLAVTQMKPYVFADPQTVENPSDTFAAIAGVLGKNRRWVRTMAAKLERAKKGGSKFMYLDRSLTQSTENKLRELDLAGIYFNHEPVRVYPKAWLGAHLLGFTNQDNSVNEGLEASYDDYLRGRDGQREVSTDGRRQKNGLDNVMIREPIPGSTVRLSIDQNIQYMTEQALRRAVQNTKAVSAGAIVMDPNTGAILAMANLPDFNPNRYGSFVSSKRKNRAVVDAYEPGSTMKIVSLAAALDTGAVRLKDRFNCRYGKIRVQDKIIRDHKPFGNLNAAEVLWYSSNVGTILIAQKVKDKTFHRYMRRFGFGQKTGVDLPAEADGIFRDLDAWTGTSKAYLSIGHEVSATPLQVLTAASVVANGGYLVQPYVAHEVVDKTGNSVDLRPSKKPERVIKASTAKAMVTVLMGVVENGTAEKAQIPGVKVFGKTGTAQRRVGNSYSREHFDASFVGFFPAQNPRYGIIVVLFDPKVGTDGGEVAAPVFSEIGSQIVLYERQQLARYRNRVVTSIKSRPDWDEYGPSEPQLIPTDAMPKLTGLQLRNALRRLRQVGITPEVEGQGTVMSQYPAPGEPLPDNGICRLLLGGEGIN